MFKRVSIFIAVAGIIFAIWVVSTNNPKVVAPPPANPPSVNPFERGVVALGLVETATRDVQIAASEAGRVVRVHTEVGRAVSRNDPLFTLDTTQLDADMLRAVAARDAARAELERIRSQPRPEDIPPLRAAVDRARALYEDSADRLRNLELAAEVNAANPDELARQRFAVQALRGSLNTAQAELDRILAGAWAPDVRIAEANLAMRQAEIDALQKRIELFTVRAPIDGTVLKRDINEGEYFAAGSGVAMVLGDLARLRVRAQVDEEDTPLLRPGAKAVGRIRGPFDVRLDLTMLWVEPLARPKRQISNAATELIDTRVVDVMFEVATPSGVTLYPGQVVDVFIDARDAAAPTGPDAARRPAPQASGPSPSNSAR